MPRGKPQPTLGYPSRTAAVEALLASDMTAEEIASEIGGTVNSVHMLIYGAQRRRAARRVLLPVETYRGLVDTADARGMTVEQLVIRLLDLAIDEQLFDPLLGDPELKHG